MTAKPRADASVRPVPPQPDAARAAARMRAAGVCGLLALALLAAPASARPTRQPPEPLPPDREAITVYGRYQPSLESLAPPGVEIGDLNIVDGRLLIQMHAESEPARRAFVRALERSGWYRGARWETVDGGVREGEYVLSVQPASNP